MKWSVLAAVAAAMLALGTTGALSAPGKGGSAMQLSGTWMTTVSLVNPPPGIDATFQALDTFVAGGGILASSSQSHPIVRSLAHGNCAHTTGRQYRCMFVWFRYDTTSGAFVGLQRVRRTMTVSSDGTWFQSTDTIEILAPDGTTVLATLQGSEAGHRLGL